MESTAKTKQQFPGLVRRSADEGREHEDAETRKSKANYARKGELIGRCLRTFKKDSHPVWELTAPEKVGICKPVAVA